MKKELTYSLLISILTSGTVTAAAFPGLFTSGQVNIVNNNSYQEGNSNFNENLNTFASSSTNVSHNSSADARSGTHNTFASASSLKSYSEANGISGNGNQVSAHGGAETTTFWRPTGFGPFGAVFDFQWDGTLTVENSTGSTNWNRASADLYFSVFDTPSSELAMADYFGSVVLLAGGTPTLSNNAIFEQNGGTQIGAVTIQVTELIPSISYSVIVSGSLSFTATPGQDDYIRFGMSTLAAAEDTTQSSFADFSNTGTFTYLPSGAEGSISQVPEPATLSLFAGMLALAVTGFGRRRNSES